jgi:hypothetical protein
MALERIHMSTSLLTAHDIATLRRHPNPKLVVRFDPSTSSVSIVDTIHIEENARRGYAAFRVDYSRILGPALAVRSTSSALKVVTTRLRSGFAASGVTLAAERAGLDGEVVFDLVLAAGR